MKNDKCTIVAEISVVTKYDGKKKHKHGKFEKRIEEILKDCYLAYMTSLVKQLPEAEKYKWEKINKNTLELVKKETENA